jgi:hypothetical protein
MECLLFHGKSLAQKTLRTSKIFFYYLRFHRSFIEASQEYYKSMFEPSSKKDELLMNVIDYFTEKWNKVKSDGISGEMKKFKYLIKTLNGFEKNQKEFEYFDYRNTKTQKVRKQFEEDGEIFYNKRKLSEFVNLIKMLHSDENKVKLLKEHVYFNYEFMTSKAELCEMFFVVSVHETILKLGDAELIDISQIYVDQFPFIEQDPKTLIFNILSRLESRSDFVRASNNLLLLHTYKKENIERKLFSVKKRDQIEYCWIIKDTPYLLIFIYKDHSNTAQIHLINSKSKQNFGKIDLNKKIWYKFYLDLEIVLNDESLNDLKTIYQLNGKVYFVKYETFYSITFQNEISIIHKFYESITELFVLNANIFAFRFNQKIVLLKINIGNEVSFQQNIVFPTGDFFLVSSKSTGFVHSASHLPIRNFKIITYDKPTNLIKIFEFNNVNQQLESFCEFEINIAYKNYKYLFVIDESFLVNGYKSPNLEMIRFAIITTENVLKVIEAKKNNEYSIVAEIGKPFQQLRAVQDKFFFESTIITKGIEFDWINMDSEFAFIYNNGKNH